MVKPTSGAIRYFFQSRSLLGALNGKFWRIEKNYRMA